MSTSISNDTTSYSQVEVNSIQACSPSSEMYQRRRGTNVSNPIVTAMLSSNNLSDCTQVKDLLYHCKQNDSSAVICDTAARYFERCYHGGN